MNRNVRKDSDSKGLVKNETPDEEIKVRNPYIYNNNNNNTSYYRVNVTKITFLIFCTRASLCNFRRCERVHRWVYYWTMYNIMYYANIQLLYLTALLCIYMHRNWQLRYKYIWNRAFRGYCTIAWCTGAINKLHKHSFTKRSHIYPWVV